MFQVSPELICEHKSLVPPTILPRFTDSTCIYREPSVCQLLKGLAVTPKNYLHPPLPSPTGSPFIPNSSAMVWKDIGVLGRNRLLRIREDQTWNWVTDSQHFPRKIMSELDSKELSRGGNNTQSLW